MRLAVLEANITLSSTGLDFYGTKAFYPEGKVTSSCYCQT